MRNKQARNLRLFENCLHSYFSSGGIIKSLAAVRVGGALIESRRQGGCGQAALPGEPGPAQFGALGTLLAPLFSDTKGIWCPVLSVPQAESECELCSGTGDGLAPRLSAEAAPGPGDGGRGGGGAPWRRLRSRSRGERGSWRMPGESPTRQGPAAQL